MAGIIIGEAAPWFTGRTPSKPTFAFSSLAGRYVLLVFLPPPGVDQEAALASVSAHGALLVDAERVAFMIASDPQTAARARDVVNGPRWFLDPEKAIGRLFGLALDDGGVRPQWMILDPTLRVLSIGPLSRLDEAFQRLGAMGAPDRHAGVPLHAPVLVVPRIFEPQICRRLIDHYRLVGGQVSGVMREVNGRTVGIVDDFKRRRDAAISDEAFKAELRARIMRRLLPEIQKAFQFRATRIERYIVARYDADEGGYFRPHRDNTTKATAHRQFACSINLNAEEFEGGDLRFPEFGSRTYRPPTGGAVVFSCSLLHEATPVTRGVRYAFLPFLFDEPREAVRQANLKFLDLPPDPPPASEGEGREPEAGGDGPTVHEGRRA